MLGQELIFLLVGFWFGVCCGAAVVTNRMSQKLKAKPKASSLLRDMLVPLIDSRIQLHTKWLNEDREQLRQELRDAEA